MEEKLKKVPKLRFKDENGEDFPAWEEKHIYELCRHHGGSALEKYVTESGKFKFISIGNYSKDGKYIDNGQRIDANHKSKSKILSKNDLVMVLNDKTCSGELIGATIVIERNNEYIYNQRSERIICNENVLPIFMWILLNSEKVRKRIAHLAQGGTQIYVNFSTVNNMAIQLPTLPEQTRISDFFTKLDSYIEQQELEVEKLKEQKKGFMQKIFSQEIRFKDENGEDFPAWEEKKLGDEIQQKTKRNHKGNIDNILSVSNKKGFIVQQEQFGKGRVASENTENYKIVEKNDFAYNPARINVGSIARLTSFEHGIVSPMYICFYCKKELVDAFLEKWICSDEFINEVNKRLEGSVRLCLTFEGLSNISINLPTLPEQTRIADFFTKLDEQIEVEQAILEKWKLLKKGFLQQMFI